MQTLRSIFQPSKPASKELFWPTGVNIDMNWYTVIWFWFFLSYYIHCLSHLEINSINNDISSHYCQYHTVSTPVWTWSRETISHWRETNFYPQFVLSQLHYLQLEIDWKDFLTVSHPGLIFDYITNSSCTSVLGTWASFKTWPKNPSPTHNGYTVMELPEPLSFSKFWLFISLKT